MPTTYKPKHKKPPAYAGSTPRGPERWLRAGHNAITRPKSENAKLFFRRLRLASDVAEVYPGSKDVVTRHRSKNWDFSLPREERGKHWKTDYYTCGVFCTAMCAQLDFGAGTWGKLVRALQADERLEPAKPTRIVRCQFCGSSIKP